MFSVSTYHTAEIFVVLAGLLLFRFLLKKKCEQRSLPPLAPGANLVFGHTKIFMRDPSSLAATVADTASHQKLIRFKFPFRELWLTRDAGQILTILGSPKTFDFGPMKSMVLKNMLGLSNKAVDVSNRDDSGVGNKPLSTVVSHERFNYLERKATHDFSKPVPHATFVQQFEKNIYHWVASCDITTQWVEMPDLYLFIRDLIFKTTTDAFFGPHLLNQSPHLAEDIWRFDHSIPFLASGCPAFLNPQAASVRARCVEAFKTWRQFAFKDKASSGSLSEWNEMSGLRCMTLRNQVFEQFPEWDESSCAASDFAVLFGLNSNIVRASFWFLLESLDSKEIFDDAMKEVTAATINSESPPQFEQKKLLTSPLLQSLFAETLRMYVSVLMLRRTRQESKLGTWNIPQNKDIAVCNYSAHMDENLWDTQGPASSHPIDRFFGRRFLKYTSAPNLDQTIDEGTKQARNIATFSHEGLSSRWFPFGAGERMCPGRHFAKYQMLLVFAVLTTTFDIELRIPSGRKPGPDMKHFGYGVMPPESETVFRIKRKA